jgi:hypothetical protein
VVRWYTLLIVFMLAGCGQPLQISTPSQTQTQPMQSSDVTVSPEIPANGVPSSAPSEQATPELGATPSEILPLEPSAAPEGTAAAAPPSIVVVPQTQVPETNEQRWRAQQQDRKVNDPPRIYVARNPEILWWYDPLVNQPVQIGTIQGEFPVQAEFVLRADQAAALEVPYVINSDFGLTAISEAVRDRMRAAGYSQSVEAYVLRNGDTQPK